jgi:hypothetical protein
VDYLVSMERSGFHALRWPVWDSLLDYGRLEWERALMDLGKNTGCCL